MTFPKLRCGLEALYNSFSSFKACVDPSFFFWGARSQAIDEAIPEVRDEDRLKAAERRAAERLNTRHVSARPASVGVRRSLPFASDASVFSRRPEVTNPSEKELK